MMGSCKGVGMMAACRADVLAGKPACTGMQQSKPMPRDPRALGPVLPACARKSFMPKANWEKALPPLQLAPACAARTEGPSGLYEFRETHLKHSMLGKALWRATTFPSTTDCNSSLLGWYRPWCKNCQPFTGGSGDSWSPWNQRLSWQSRVSMCHPAHWLPVPSHRSFVPDSVIQRCFRRLGPVETQRKTLCTGLKTASLWRGRRHPPPSRGPS